MMITTNQQLEEHLDHEFFARFDDVRERYSAELEDLRQNELAEDDYMNYLTQVDEAGFGDDVEAYEASWARTFDFYTQLGG